MVSRDRRRDAENDIYERKLSHTQSYSMADMASLQALYNFRQTIPKFEPAPEPPSPERIKKPITDTSGKLKRVEKGTGKGKTRLETGWHWTDYYKNSVEWRTVSRNIEFFNQPLNYHWGHLWAIRHTEIEYEGESDPL